MGKDVLTFETLVLDDPVVNHGGLRVLCKFGNSGARRELVLQAPIAL